MFDWAQASQNNRSAGRFGSSGIDLSVLVRVSPASWVRSPVEFCFILLSGLTRFPSKGFSLSKLPYPLTCGGLMVFDLF